MTLHNPSLVTFTCGLAQEESVSPPSLLFPLPTAGSLPSVHEVGSGLSCSHHGHLLLSLLFAVSSATFPLPSKPNISQNNLPLFPVLSLPSQFSA